MTSELWPAPAGAGTAHGTVAVSMPYYQARYSVRAAVEAVLGQTYRDLRLYLINDGDHAAPPWPELTDITDPRLIRVEMPANRGRYFADAVALTATDAPWFAVHDADDTAEPEWLETLVGACVENGWVAAFAPQYVNDVNGRRLEPVAEPFRWTARLRQLAHHAGVYDTDVLREVGGPHPAYRIGYDTLLVNLVSHAGPIGAVARPLYTRNIRPGSLTTSPLTRRGSITRRTVRRELEKLWAAAQTHGPGRAVRHSIPVRLRVAVVEAAAAVRAGETVRGPQQRELTVGVLSEAVWETDGWALDRHTAEELAAHLDRTRPRVIVESGSGMSTVLLAEYAARTGATVFSLEHQAQYADKTREALYARGLGLAEADVTVCLAPLELVDVPGSPRQHYWYGARVPSGIDFALVDGPPGKIGRDAALFALMPHMNPGGGWEIWVDDAGRDGEREAAVRWREQFAFREEYIPTPKGLLRILPPQSPAPRTAVDAGDVAVTVLTGGRPDLLLTTITSILEFAPGLLESAHVAVLHNGANDDPATAALIRRWDWVDHVTTLEDRLPVADASAALLGFEAPRPFTLHLEDDWQVATVDTGWLDIARNALTSDPRIGQVRLRHRGEKVLSTHMVTRRPIWWTAGPDGTQVSTAHYTLNPSLMRSADTPALWPSPSERGAARQFYNQSWLTAQVTPGVFRHIGGGASLRLGERP